MKIIRLIKIGALIATLCNLPLTFGCTGIRLVADDGHVVYARTLEFGKDLHSNVIMIPRAHAFVGTTDQPTTPGLRWKSTYAVVGANAENIVGIVDGVNEKGLAGGLFYFPDYAQFQRVTTDNAHHTIAPWELMTWILTTFATVAQVQEALPKITVGHVVFDAWGFVPPVHAVVHDATGNCIIIEYVKGALTIHQNPLGVCTNAPTFDWHMTNLSNYINLSPFNVQEKDIKTAALKQLGQGSGLLGLPGDFTSPSRFVRAALFSQATVNVSTTDDARDAAFHILNTFDIPLGVIRTQKNGTIHYEYTQWTSCNDLHNRRFYFRTHDNSQTRVVDLMGMPLDAAAPIHIAMQGAQVIENITPKK